MVFVYALRQETADEKKERLMLSRLPLEEQNRLNSLQNQKRKAESLYAWSLLAALLRREFGTEELPQIARGEMGKPYFPACPGLHISLSHTEGAALVAAADIPLGVDMEKIRVVPDRVKGIFGALQSEEEFWQAWTEAESRLKLHGRGVGAVRQEIVPMEGEQTRRMEIFPGYAAAVSFCGEDEVKIVEISPEELYEKKDTV